jgi:hypothetical protein
LPFSAALDTLLLPIDLTLTPAKLGNAEKGFDRLQPGMTVDQCMKMLGVPKRQYVVFLSGRPPWFISIQYDEGIVLLVVCDDRGSVVSVQLDKEKWEWKEEK